MSVRQFGGLTASRCTFDEAFLDQVRLINILYRSGVLAHSGGYGVQTDWSSAELVDDGGQELVIYLVQTEGVDIQGFESILGDVQIHSAIALDLCKVAYTAEQGIGYTRRTAAATGYLSRSMAVDIYA